MKNCNMTLNKHIILRELHKSDREKLESLICEEWNYEKYCCPQVAAKFARVYLNSCLAEQTYTQVAIIDNVPVGIVMVKNLKVHKCPLAIRLQLLLSTISLYLSKEGRKIAKIYECEDVADKELLMQCKKEYQGELSYFIVSPKYRGKRIGKLLFQKAIDYIYSQKISEFFLFTDTNCNYSFYEHLGMKSKCIKDYDFGEYNHSKKVSFFIYVYCIQ